jgi:eukaryotic-like serine/threonine-protein kinase
MKYALLVGINDYGDENNNLICPINDCLEFEKILSTTNYDFNVIKLLNESATKQNVREYFNLILNENNVTDFIFYFSGHGLSTSTDSFLCTSDTQKYDEGIGINLLTRMISDFIEKEINVTVFLDACHTGDFKIYKEPGNFNINPDKVDSILSTLSNNYAVFAACGRTETCNQNPEKGLSEFTISLIDALNGGCADEHGNITVTMMFRYINSTYNIHDWPRAIYKANISDDYFLGKGFEPRILQINNDVDKINEIIIHGKNLLNDYLKIGETSIDEWKTIQFNASVKKLSSIISWSSSQERKYIELKSNRLFIDFKKSVTTRLKRLGNIEDGTLFNDFIFSERIGSGSFGTVWKIIDRYNGEIRALKIYHSNDLDLLDKSSRFARGYKAMAKLNHPQVVKIKTWYDAPYAFDMEYIDGGNLRELSGSISDPESILMFLLSCSNVMAYTHREGIMHRDIKPENVLAIWNEENKQYKPVITDFDLAWFDTATKMTKDALGSLSYAAPEQLSTSDSKSTHQPTVDIYSFGQLIYFLIQCKDPKQNSMDYNRENLKNKLSSWTSPVVANALSLLYDKCTETNNKDRFQNFDEITNLLQSIITDQFKLQTGTISSQNYVDFVLHGFYSISQSRTANSFLSITGRTVVVLKLEYNNKLYITLSSNGLPSLESVNNHSARKILFERFTTKFKQNKDIQISHGNEGAFQVIVCVYLRVLDIDSLKYIRDIITKSIHELEH